MKELIRSVVADGVAEKALFERLRRRAGEVDKRVTVTVQGLSLIHI